MDSIGQFYQLLSRFTELFEQMLSLEDQKLEALANNDIELLDQHMKTEQAYAMKLKGLELKREKIQTQCGFGGLTLNEIITRVADEDKEKMTQAYVMLTKYTKSLKSVLSNVNSYIELRLYGLEQELQKLKEKRAENVRIGTCNKSGTKNVKMEFKSKKV